jgi:hypothetical protein
MQNDQWPEDEASLTYQTYRDLLVLEGQIYADEWLEKQKVHMHKVFDDMLDIERYDSRLNALLEGRP